MDKRLIFLFSTLIQQRSLGLACDLAILSQVRLQRAFINLWYVEWPSRSPPEKGQSEWKGSWWSDVGRMGDRKEPIMDRRCGLGAKCSQGSRMDCRKWSQLCCLSYRDCLSKMPGIVTSPCSKKWFPWKTACRPSRRSVSAGYVAQQHGPVSRKLLKVFFTNAISDSKPFHSTFLLIETPNISLSIISTI